MATCNMKIKVDISEIKKLEKDIERLKNKLKNIKIRIKVI